MQEFSRNMSNFAELEDIPGLEYASPSPAPTIQFLLEDAESVSASARIGEVPGVKVIKNKNVMPYFGVGIVAFAAMCFVLLGATLHLKRARFMRALADSDDDLSVDEEACAIEMQAAQSCSESLAETAYHHTERACGKNITDSTLDQEADVVNRFSTDYVTERTTSHDESTPSNSIPIHQYCENSSCTICRNWKKPMFTDLSYKVDDTSMENGGEVGDDIDGFATAVQGNCSYLFSE